MSEISGRNITIVKDTVLRIRTTPCHIHDKANMCSSTYLKSVTSVHKTVPHMGGKRFKTNVCKQISKDGLSADYAMFESQWAATLQYLQGFAMWSVYTVTSRYIEAEGTKTIIDRLKSYVHTISCIHVDRFNSKPRGRWWWRKLHIKARYRPCTVAERNFYLKRKPLERRTLYSRTLSTRYAKRSINATHVVRGGVKVFSKIMKTVDENGKERKRTTKRWK